MNSWLNKVERAVGRYAIPQLTKWMILTYIIGYIIYFIQYVGIGLINYIYLSPELILHGQIWRLFTWVLMPPSRPDLFTIIMLLFYYQIGTALEQTWGEFRYNLYIFSGVLFMVIGAFILYAFGMNVDGMFTTYYINMSIFLAFAACYPNMEVLLYFIIPLKMKYLAYIDVAFLIYQSVVSSWPERVAIIVSLLNFVIFFFTTRNYRSISPAEHRRKKQFREAFRRGPFYGQGKTAASSGTASSAGENASFTQKTARNGQITKHKCAVCGRTELDGDNLEFRFCSKCDGNYEYCQDHLFTHKHIKFNG